MRLKLLSHVVGSDSPQAFVIWVNPLGSLEITDENVPQNPQEVRAGEDDHNKSENLVDLNQHEGLQYGVRFALNVILDGSLQDFIVVVVNGLLDTVDIQKL